MKTFRLYKRDHTGREMPKTAPGWKDRPFHFRFIYRGHVYNRGLETNDSVEAQRRARLKYNEIRTAIQNQDYKRLENTKLRHTVTDTIADILPHYRAYRGRIAERTKEKNILCLRAIICSCSARPEAACNVRPVAAWETTPLTELTDDLIWKWKQKILERAHAPENDPARCEQIQRSANSVLLMARSIFARSRKNDFPDYYKRAGGIELPDCIKGFRDHPGFGGVAKTDYRPPHNNIIAKTLAALDSIGSAGDSPAVFGDPPKTSSLDSNMFIACWLAIGFGLRAGDIKRARKADFKQIGDDVFFDPPWRAKNNKFPLIGVQLDAWPRLQKFLTTGDPQDYALTGNDTERSFEVFRRISAWMKSLGWQTTHHIHELRAWAGCQIVMGDGHGEHWERGRIFLRHAHVSTTQNYYGQHIKVRLEKVPLPKIISTEFTPKLVAI